MHVIVTRPLEDAQRTAASLERMGHVAILAPLLQIVPRPGPALPLDGVQAILASSANGVRALAARSLRRDLPLFAVGPQTADAARQAGFVHVHDAGGDAQDLARLVARQAGPAGGALFHAAGEEARGALAGTLAAAGFTVRSETLYAAEAARQLPGPAATAIAGGEAGGVLLYSPRSAALFAQLVRAAGLAGACRTLRAYCISPAAAAALGEGLAAAVHVAAHPDGDRLLALLDATDEARAGKIG